MWLKIDEFNARFSTHYRAIISFRFADHLMRLELRELEIFPTEKTFEQQLIQRVYHEPVWFIIRRELCAAVWTTRMCFSPFIDAFLAAQHIAFTAFHHLRCNHI